MKRDDILFDVILQDRPLGRFDYSNGNFTFSGVDA
jgi:hypothetical protein